MVKNGGGGHFADLRPSIEAARTRTAKHLIIHRRQKTATAVRQEFERVLRKLEIPQWKRLFHNLRASCETDLMRDGHPAHVVCQWLGNSPAVATKHYLPATEADFEKATGGKLRFFGG